MNKFLFALTILLLSISSRPFLFAASPVRKVLDKERLSADNRMPS